METKSKRLEDGNVEVTVELSADEVQREIDAAYRIAGKNRIPGFRPGKAPRKVLDNHFGGRDYFLATAAEELVRAFTPLATEELDLVPLSNADFSEIDLAVEGEPYVFDFRIEVIPELELSSYDPIQIELPSTEPTEEEMQARIDALLAYDVTTDEEGNEHPAELTDEWVKTTLEFDTVEDLKERIAESIREQKDQELSRLREALSMQELSNRLAGEVPVSLVHQTEQDNYRDFFRTLQQQRMTLDGYLEQLGMTPEDFRESMRSQAEESAAMALALDALARHLEFTATEDEVKEEFKLSGIEDPDKFYLEFSATGRLAEVRQGLMRMKASQHILDTLEVFEPGTLYPVAEDEDPALEIEAESGVDAEGEDTAAEPDAPAEDLSNEADTPAEDAAAQSDEETEDTAAAQSDEEAEDLSTEADAPAEDAAPDPDAED